MHKINRNSCYCNCNCADVNSGIEFKDFILGFCQSTFLCTTLKCIEKFRIPFIKSGIPASNLGSSELRKQGIPLNSQPAVIIT